MTILVAALAGVAAPAAAALAWAHFEAGWVRLRTLELPLPGLDPALDGLRLVHLSDFHLGFPSRGRRAVERAVEWTAAREPDLVLVSGDLLARPRAEAHLRSLLARLPRAFVVLGNHDFAVSRDPFSRLSAPTDLRPAHLLSDESAVVELRGRRVQVVGVDPRSYRQARSRPDRLADDAAALRILLCHFPYVVDRVRPGAFHLVLAGHLHDGQICIPYWGGKLRLAHLRARYPSGVFRRPGGVLHVSPGLGTTFVPFRFCARPEATELVLRAGQAA